MWGKHTNIRFREDVGLTELDNCTAQYRTNKATVDGVWPQSQWILPMFQLFAYTSMEAYRSMLKLGITNRLGIRILPRKKCCLLTPTLPQTQPWLFID